MELLKQEIKRWEHRFEKQHGRKATKEDIRGDAVVAGMYKEFWRARKKARAPERELETATGPEREREVVVEAPALGSTTTVSTSPTAYGPTPQVNGRVLGLLEVSTTPTLSPSKASGSTPAAPTPLPVDNTPSAYFRNTQAASPFVLPVKKRKSLLAMLEEAREHGEESPPPDLYEANNGGSPGSAPGSAPGSPEPPGQPPRRLRKTQKRSTRRVKIGLEATAQHDLLAGRNLQAELERLAEGESAGREPTPPPLPRRLAPRVSANYRRLNIRDGRSKRGRRR